MPFTLFHLGPGFTIGFLFRKIFHVPALLVASVVVDFEPLLILILGLDEPLHGFFHTFLGGTIAAVLTAAAMYFFQRPINEIMRVFRLAQKGSLKKIVWTSVFGVYFHVVLDAFLYPDMSPLYPFGGNPLFGLFSALQVYAFCTVLLFLGTLIYLVWIAGLES